MRYALTPGLRSVRVYGWEIGLLQVWKITKNLILGHARSKHIQHVPHRYPETTDTGLAGSLPGHEGNPGKVGLVGSGHTPIMRIPAS